jgi:hypothetical protein
MPEACRIFARAAWALRSSEDGSGTLLWYLNVRIPVLGNKMSIKVGRRITKAFTALPNE